MQDFILREWQHDDIEAVTQAANNPNIAKNLRNTFPNPYTIEDAQWYKTDKPTIYRAPGSAGNNQAVER
mgnify:CR=1 FL=1